MWEALLNQQPEVAPDAPQAPTVAPKKGKASKQARGGGRTPTASEGSKTSQVLDLIRRPEGATLAAIMEATGWQPHSVRGFISGTLGKKMGLKIESAKNEAGGRTYRIIE